MTSTTDARTRRVQGRDTRRQRAHRARVLRARFMLAGLAAAVTLAVVACVPPPDDGPPPTTSTTTTTEVPPTGGTFDVTTGEALPPFTAGEPVDVQLTHASAPNAEWVVIGGALPAGVTLSPTGRLTGTPTGPSALWSADLTTTSTPNTSNAAVAGALVIDPVHLWGWTYEPQAPEPFPGTVHTHPDEPLLVTELSTTGYRYTGFWTVNPDGSTEQPPTFRVPKLKFDVDIDLTLAATTPGLERNLSSGALGILADFNSCTVDLFDVTRGPLNPLPVAATLTSTATQGESCGFAQTGDTVFIVRGGPEHLTVDVFSVATRTLVRTVKVAAPDHNRAPLVGFDHRTARAYVGFSEPPNFFYTRPTFLGAVGASADDDVPLTEQQFHGPLFQDFSNFFESRVSFAFPSTHAAVRNGSVFTSFAENQGYGTIHAYKMDVDTGQGSTFATRTPGPGSWQPTGLSVADSGQIITSHLEWELLPGGGMQAVQQQVANVAGGSAGEAFTKALSFGEPAPAGTPLTESYLVQFAG